MIKKNIIVILLSVGMIYGVVMAFDTQPKSVDVISFIPQKTNVKNIIMKDIMETPTSTQKSATSTEKVSTSTIENPPKVVTKTFQYDTFVKIGEIYSTTTATGTISVSFDGYNQCRNNGKNTDKCKQELQYQLDQNIKWFLESENGRLKQQKMIDYSNELNTK